MKDIFLQDNIIEKFLEYLASRGLSKNSYKNYKSDIVHFSNWLILKMRSLGVLAESLKDTIPFFKPSMGNEYKNYLLEQGVPNMTVNRRLSSLRLLSKYLLMLEIVDFDFMDQTGNVLKGNIDSTHSRETTDYDRVVYEFAGYLNTNKASKNTIKSYLSDIKHFISWLETREVAVNKQ